MTLNSTFLPLSLEALPQCVADHKEQGWRFVQMLCVLTDEGTDMIYTFCKGSDLENYTIKAVARETEVPSITDKYLNAFVFENEANDLFGMNVVGNALDFGGKFYQVSVSEPMTVISPAQKAAREKAAKLAAAKAAKEAEAKPAEEAGAKPAEAGVGMEAKLAGMDPEKAAKVQAAMAAKAKKAATQAAQTEADDAATQENDGKEGE